MKKTLLLLALFASLTILPAATHACSVVAGWPPSASESMKESDAMFVGTVTSIVQDKSLNGEYRITFSVDESYKGSVDGTITVRAQSSSAACGYDDGYGSFEKGSVWSVYADGNEKDGYTTNSISLNTKYKSVDAAVKALADAGLVPEDTDEPMACTMQYAPVCGKTTDGTIKTFGNSCVLGAEKATFLYEGECTVSVAAVPTQDLWSGMRNADVTWLQEFLISKITGTAAAALKAVGATGYFGALTRTALAEYQAAHLIMPAAGYFGAKTRASINANQVPAPTSTFKGTISAVDVGCFVDGICSVTVDGKEVILLTGMRAGTMLPVGSLQGVESIGDLEKKIGSEAEVYAAQTLEGGAEYTLYGNAAFYVKVLK